MSRLVYTFFVDGYNIGSPFDWRNIQGIRIRVLVDPICFGDVYKSCTVKYFERYVR